MCVCMLSPFSHVQSFVTLWTIAHQAPLPMGFSRQEYWSGLPCPPAVDLFDSGIELASLMSPALSGGCFTTSASWEAPNHKETGIPDHLTCLLRNLYAGQEETELDMEKQIGSKLEKESSRLYIVTLLIYLICRVHHMKCWAG